MELITCHGDVVRTPFDHKAKGSPEDKRADFCAYLARDGESPSNQYRDVEGPIALYLPGNTYPGDGPQMRGRGMLTSCFDSRFYCATVRTEWRECTHAAKHTVDERGKIKELYRASTSLDSTKPFLFATSDYCDAIAAAVGIGADSPAASAQARNGANGAAQESEQSGLLLITGSTNCLKSQIVRGLIYKMIARLRDAFVAGASSGENMKQRRPHLLTLEDPIEKWWAVHDSEEASKQTCLDPWELQTRGLDYTPRSIGTGSEHDAPNLDIALKSALRQSPSVVYVGETREIDQWKAVMNFAGTGHLIVTTAHAGSLSEAMARLFHALTAKSPADRQQVASRIFGIVHLHRWTDGTHEVILPTLWRRTAASESSLVANGLGSLLPHESLHGTVIRGANGAHAGCLGRMGMLNLVFKAAETREKGQEGTKEAASNRLIGELRTKSRDLIEKRALSFDLKGR